MTTEDSHEVPSENLLLRLRRAKSWLERAKQEANDPDAAFVFYWIAVNAAYGRDQQQRFGSEERDLFDDYFKTVLSIDPEKRIGDAIWNNFSGSARLLLDNHWVYMPFWKNLFGMCYDDWQLTFERDKRRGLKTLAEGNTRAALNIIFDRLYVVRNQIMHGGATWRTGRNRDQVRDGAAIMALLVPLFIELMERNPQIEWGPPDYSFEDETGSIL